MHPASSLAGLHSSCAYRTLKINVSCAETHLPAVEAESGWPCWHDQGRRGFEEGVGTRLHGHQQLVLKLQVPRRFFRAPGSPGGAASCLTAAAPPSAPAVSCCGASAGA